MVSEPTTPEEPEKHVLGAGDDKLASLIHDLRHALHAMRLGVELLKETPDREKFTELCNAIEVEAREAAKVLDELVVVVRGRDAER
jgi:signal transduction histidine kinase